ncbi:MAG: class I SAM-dependent methyltransferase [Lachnospiraceae bacterium]|nr:class I SAM-dependent methyltransferase [Lachnospiraceae bacterium]
MTEQIGNITLDLTHYPGQDLYCDGKVEDELLEIVKTHKPAEYQAVIEEKLSWPVLYHLSHFRENIVDWIPMEKTAKVLEVGSGCGAITGALAKKAGQVTSVDLSKKRSLINAYRHQGCDNVTIHVGNFKDIEPDLPTDYDYIFLVGVFEYGISYMGTERPFEEFLSIILKHISQNGRIVIAIENKYGMKYFAGCKEDHLGSYFSGIENYAAGGGVRTFSRPGLEQLFLSCGGKDYHFYYPYPDYKFMTTVYSDERLPGKGELSNNLRNFDRDRLLLFDEKNAFDGAIEDGLFPIFSNSYEVIIGKDVDVAYAKYSNDRAPQFQIRTEFVKRDGSFIVRKAPLTDEAATHVVGMAGACAGLSGRYRGGDISINNCFLTEVNGAPAAEFEFLEGRLLSELLDERLFAGDMDGFMALFEEYLEKTGYHQTFPVSDYDLAFDNIMVQGDTWTIIDYEWTMEEVIELKETAFRAVQCYLSQDTGRAGLDLNRILARLGITETEAENYRTKEKEFQDYVTGKSKAMSDMRALIGYSVIPLDLLQKLYQVDKSVQIYEDRGEGFSESRSYFVRDAYVGTQEAELTLSVDGSVRKLRIDPTMEPCVVRISELSFNGQDVSLKDKRVVSTNGKDLKKDAVTVFASEDPNICVNLEGFARQERNVLRVKMEVARLPKQVAERLAESVKKIF